MSGVLATAAIGILVVIGLALARAFTGPTIHDRVLAVNMVGTKTVLLICVIDFLGGNNEFLDIALVYALINFIGVIAMLRFFQQGSHLAHDDPDSEERA